MSNMHGKSSKGNSGAYIENRLVYIIYSRLGNSLGILVTETLLLNYQSPIYYGLHTLLHEFCELLTFRVVFASAVLQCFRVHDLGLELLRRQLT